MISRVRFGITWAETRHKNADAVEKVSPPAAIDYLRIHRVIALGIVIGDR